MSDLLDKIDDSLQEVEEQLLQEFQRIRNTLSDQPFEPIDTGIRNSLSSVVDEVHHMLEHSGDKTNLQLMTERHENLFARISVLRQLFKTKIPTAYLHEVHSDVKSSRRTLEQKVQAKRAQQEDAEDSGGSGLFSSLKGMFGSKQSQAESARNRIRITAEEEKALSPVQVYLDNGIYSASRELAMLVHRVNDSIERGTLAEDLKKPPPPRGKAQFASRDLSRQEAAALDTPKRARTPEEIRRKLEASQRAGQGASRFESRDLSSAAPPPKTDKPLDSRSFTQADKPAPAAPTEKRDIAQTPEEIRRKLAARQAGGAGKASFEARDIEPVAPKTPPAGADKDKDKQEEKPAPSQGKAVFEARDLSKPGPGKS